jgi:hypothetical protein
MAQGRDLAMKLWSWFSQWLLHDRWKLTRRSHTDELGVRFHLDHALTQRAVGLFGHRECSCLAWG